MDYDVKSNGNTRQRVLQFSCTKYLGQRIADRLNWLLKVAGTIGKVRKLIVFKIYMSLESIK